MDNSIENTGNSKEQEKETLSSKENPEKLEKTWEDEDWDDNGSAISVGC